MAAPNIERFNALVGAIFAHLYEAFPMPTDLSPERFKTILVAEGKTPDSEPRLQREDDVFFQSTIQWLGRHGYLHHGSCLSSSVVLNCVLTAQALELLKAIPESLESGGPSMGEQLVAASKDGITGKVKDLAGDFLSKAVAFGAKAATDWASS